MLLNLKEVAIIHHSLDDIFHFVGEIGLVGDNRIELLIHAVDGIGARLTWRIVQVIRWNEAEQFANHGQAFGVILSHEVGNARGLVVSVRAAELVLGDFFVGDCLDDVRSGDEHVRGLVHHEDEIGNGWGIDGATSAGPHDRRNLRNHAAIKRVAQKNICVTRQGHDTLLNPRTAGIV